jgi:copper oxidase (laccase) domain-containing protein
MEQVHGNRIKNVQNEDDIKKGGLLKGADGVIFEKKFQNIAAGVRVADCIPVFVFRKNFLAGVLHAGWRGIASGIGMKIMENGKWKMEDVSVFAGPHICGKCFETGEDVRKLFPADTVSGNRVNLFEALRLQFVRSGVKPANIRLLKEKNFCTYENDDYFSHRRDDASRMLAFAIQH